MHSIFKFNLFILDALARKIFSFLFLFSTFIVPYCLCIKTVECSIPSDLVGLHELPVSAVFSRHLV